MPDAEQPKPGFPTLRSIVLDTTDVRRLAEFYRQLLGYDYVPGDEPPGHNQPDTADWLALQGPDVRLSFQQVPELPRSTWPTTEVPQQVHLDFEFTEVPDLAAHHERALALGATMLVDEFDSPEQPMYIYADPAGHTFCMFVMLPES
ncbi:VOC family protein [Nocardia transvalensis]|nr:VOC family protein [Nocardia transvalensis]